MKPIFILSLFIPLCAFGVGCGKKSGKYPVAGNVTWNGAPIKTGFVTFKPKHGKFAPEAGPIKDGQFSFNARPGSNIVEFSATKESGYDKGMQQPKMVQYIPAEYNSESKTIVEVSETAENKYEFKLAGK